MYRYLILLFLLISNNLFPQQTLTKFQAKRLFEVSKLWGYFPK